MRVSVYEDDEGYVSNPGDYEIYLDGKEVGYAVIADEKAGYVVKYKREENGFVLKKAVFPAEFETEIVYGKVEIRRPD
jgi:hypothetical protein